MIPYRDWKAQVDSLLETRIVLSQNDLPRFDFRYLHGLRFTPPQAVEEYISCMMEDKQLTSELIND